MPFVAPHKPIEDCPPGMRRLFEHVDRILDGNDLRWVAIVVANLMLKVILALEPNHDQAALDSAIDDLATSLKEASRSHLDRVRKEGYQ